jgi:hypothetical protein
MVFQLVCGCGYFHHQHLTPQPLILLPEIQNFDCVPVAVAHFSRLLSWLHILHLLLHVGMIQKHSLLNNMPLNMDSIDYGVGDRQIGEVSEFTLIRGARSPTAIAKTNLPDWGQAAEIAFQTIFPHKVMLLLLQDIQRLRDLARKSWN